MSKAHFGHY